LHGRVSSIRFSQDDDSRVVISHGPLSLAPRVPPDTTSSEGQLVTPHNTKNGGIRGSSRGGMARSLVVLQGLRETRSVICLEGRHSAILLFQWPSMPAAVVVRHWALLLLQRRSMPAVVVALNGLDDFFGIAGCHRRVFRMASSAVSEARRGTFGQFSAGLGGSTRLFAGVGRLSYLLGNGVPTIHLAAIHLTAIGVSHAAAIGADASFLLSGRVSNRLCIETSCILCFVRPKEKI